MLFSTPRGGRFSRASPFMKTLGTHVHRSLPRGSSFAKSATTTYHLATQRAIEENWISRHRKLAKDASLQLPETRVFRHRSASRPWMKTIMTTAILMTSWTLVGKRVFSLSVPQRVFSLRTGAPRSFRRKAVPERGYSITGLDPDRTVKCSGRQ